MLYKHKKLKIDVYGTPHRRLECSRYVSHAGQEVTLRQNDDDMMALESEFPSSKSLSSDEVSEGHAYHSSSELSDRSNVLSNWEVTQHPGYALKEGDRLQGNHSEQSNAQVDNIEYTRAPGSMRKSVGRQERYPEEAGNDSMLATDSNSEVTANNSVGSNSFDAVHVPVLTESRNAYINNLESAPESSTSTSGQPLINNLSSTLISRDIGRHADDAVSSNLQTSESRNTTHTVSSLASPATKDDDNLNNFDSGGENDDTEGGGGLNLRGTWNTDENSLEEFHSISSDSAVLVSHVNCRVGSHENVAHSLAHSSVGGSEDSAKMETENNQLTDKVRGHNTSEVVLAGGSVVLENPTTVLHGGMCWEDRQEMDKEIKVMEEAAELNRAPEITLPSRVCDHHRKVEEGLTSVEAVRVINLKASEIEEVKLSVTSECRAMQDQSVTGRALNGTMHSASDNVEGIKSLDDEDGDENNLNNFDTDSDKEDDDQAALPALSKHVFTECLDTETTVLPVSDGHSSVEGSVSVHEQLPCASDYDQLHRPLSNRVSFQGTTVHEHQQSSNVNSVHQWRLTDSKTCPDQTGPCSSAGQVTVCQRDTSVQGSEQHTALSSGPLPTACLDRRLSSPQGSADQVLPEDDNNLDNFDTDSDQEDDDHAARPALSKHVLNDHQDTQSTVPVTQEGSLPVPQNQLRPHANDHNQLQPPLSDHFYSQGTTTTCQHKQPSNVNSIHQWYATDSNSGPDLTQSWSSDGQISVCQRDTSEQSSEQHTACSSGALAIASLDLPHNSSQDSAGQVLPQEDNNLDNFDADSDDQEDDDHIAWPVLSKHVLTEPQDIETTVPVSSGHFRVEENSVPIYHDQVMNYQGDTSYQSDEQCKARSSSPLATECLDHHLSSPRGSADHFLPQDDNNLDKFDIDSDQDDDDPSAKLDLSTCILTERQDMQTTVPGHSKVGEYSVPLSLDQMPHASNHDQVHPPLSHHVLSQGTTTYQHQQSSYQLHAIDSNSGPDLTQSWRSAGQITDCQRDTSEQNSEQHTTHSSGSLSTVYLDLPHSCPQDGADQVFPEDDNNLDNFDTDSDQEDDYHAARPGLSKHVLTERLDTETTVPVSHGHSRVVLTQSSPQGNAYRAITQNASDLALTHSSSTQSTSSQITTDLAQSQTTNYATLQNVGNQVHSVVTADHNLPLIHYSHPLTATDHAPKSMIENLYDDDFEANAMNDFDSGSDKDSDRDACVEEDSKLLNDFLVISDGSLKKALSTSVASPLGKFESIKVPQPDEWKILGKKTTSLPNTLEVGSDRSAQLIKSIPSESKTSIVNIPMLQDNVSDIEDNIKHRPDRGRTDKHSTASVNTMMAADDQQTSSHSTRFPGADLVLEVPSVLRTDSYEEEKDNINDFDSDTEEEDPIMTEVAALNNVNSGFEVDADAVSITPTHSKEDSSFNCKPDLGSRMESQHQSLTSERELSWKDMEMTGNSSVTVNEWKSSELSSVPGWSRYNHGGIGDRCGTIISTEDEHNLNDFDTDSDSKENGDTGDQHGTTNSMEDGHNLNNFDNDSDGKESERAGDKHACSSLDDKRSLNNFDTDSDSKDNEHAGEKHGIGSSADLNDFDSDSDSKERGGAEDEHSSVEDEHNLNNFDTASDSEEGDSAGSKHGTGSSTEDEHILNEFDTDPDSNKGRGAVNKCGTGSSAENEHNKSGFDTESDSKESSGDLALYGTMGSTFEGSAELDSSKLLFHSSSIGQQKHSDQTLASDDGDEVVLITSVDGDAESVSVPSAISQTLPTINEPLSSELNNAKSVGSQVPGNIEHSDDKDEDENLSQFDREDSDACETSVTICGGLFGTQTLEERMILVDNKNKLDLSGQDIGEEHVIALSSELSKCKDLQILDLSDNSIGSGGFVSLAHALKACIKLEVLVLSSNMMGSDGLAAISSNLKDCTLLHTLVLADNNIDYDGVEVLADSLMYMRNVKVLDLSDNAIDRDGVVVLADGLKYSTNFINLNLSCNRINSDGVISLAAGLRACVNFEILNLSCTNIDSSGVAALVEGLKACVSLISLDVSCNKVNCSGAVALAEGLKYWCNIQELNLSSNDIRIDGAIALGEALKYSVNLRMLSLSSNAIGSEGASAISQGLQNCKKLHSLLISSNYLGSAGMAALSVGIKRCVDLRVIELSHNASNSDGVIALAKGLVACRNISQLNLSYNKIGTDGAMALAHALQSCSVLTTLNLSNNCIGSNGAFALAENLKYCNSLILLNLSQNQIGFAGVEALNEVAKIRVTMKTLDLSGNACINMEPSVRSPLSLHPDGKNPLTLAGKSLNNFDSDSEGDFTEKGHVLENKLNDFDSESDEEISHSTSASHTLGEENWKKKVPVILSHGSKPYGSVPGVFQTKYIRPVSYSAGRQELTPNSVRNAWNDLDIGSGSASFKHKGLMGSFESKSAEVLSDGSHKSESTAAKMQNQMVQQYSTASIGVASKFQCSLSSSVVGDSLRAKTTSEVPISNDDCDSSENLNKFDSDDEPHVCGPSSMNNLGSSDHFRSLDSNSSVSPQENTDQAVVSQFSDTHSAGSERKDSFLEARAIMEHVDCSTTEDKRLEENKFEVTSTGTPHNVSTVSISGDANAGSNTMGLKELGSQSGHSMLAKDVSTLSRESGSDQVSQDASYSATTAPTVLSCNEGLPNQHFETDRVPARKVVSDISHHETETENEAAKFLGATSFRPLRQDSVTTSLPLNLDHASQLARKSGQFNAGRIYSEDNIVATGRGDKKGKRHSSRTKTVSSGSDSDVSKKPSTDLQKRMKSFTQSTSEGVSLGNNPSPPMSGASEATLPPPTEKTPEGGPVSKATESQHKDDSEKEDKGVFKYPSDSLLAKEQMLTPKMQKQRETKGTERSHSPMSDDIGDEGSDNYGNFDSEGGPNSGDESMREGYIHIKSNSELNLSGLFAGSPGRISGSNGGGTLPDMQSDEKNESYARLGSETGLGSTSIQAESLDGTQSYQAVPPPIMTHVLMGSDRYQDSVTPSELGKGSTDTDQALSMSNRSDRTKSVPKANTASRSGYLDNILAPDYFGEVDSENNLSAEEDEGRSAMRSEGSTSDRDASFSEKESDAYSGSEFNILSRIKKVNVRSKKFTDASDSGSVQSKMSKKKSKGKNGKKKRPNRSGTGVPGGGSGSNSEDSVDQILEEETPALTSASVTESMTPSQANSASGAPSNLWEGPLIADVVDVDLSRSKSFEARPKPFEPLPGEEVHKY